MKICNGHLFKEGKGGGLTGGNTTRQPASFTYPTSTAGIISKMAPITKDKPGNTSLVG